MYGHVIVCRHVLSIQKKPRYITRLIIDVHMYVCTLAFINLCKHVLHAWVLYVRMYMCNLRLLRAQLLRHPR